MRTALLFPWAAWLAAAVLPPPQPASGPGGSQYRHAAVRAERRGQGARAWWIFEPASPAPASAPIVVFLHGWGATNPRAYRPWIDHLVRRGNLVVYPVYQDGLLDPIGPMGANAAAAIRDALAHLEGAAVRGERERLAMVGHSLGAAMAASLAASYRSEGLPPARALMCVEPGKTWTRAPQTAIQLADLSQIPASTLLLTVAGEDDRIARDIDARKIFLGATAVPPGNKNFVTVLTDRHGDPPLVAGHFSPAGRKVDALDYYGYWKLFDALCNAAFYGTHRRYALGDTPEQRYMGVWSDGVPVKELRVTTGVQAASGATTGTRLSAGGGGGRPYPRP